MEAAWHDRSLSGWRLRAHAQAKKLPSCVGRRPCGCAKSARGFWLLTLFFPPIFFVLFFKKNPRKNSDPHTHEKWRGGEGSLKKQTAQPKGTLSAGAQCPRTVPCALSFFFRQCSCSVPNLWPAPIGNRPRCKFCIFFENAGHKCWCCFFFVAVPGGDLRSAKS